METPPTVELSVRQYLRGHSQLMTLLSGDTRKIDLDDPGLGPNFITLFRSGGGFTDHINYEETGMSFHCWGVSWLTANRLARTVVRALKECHTYTHSDTFVDRCTVTSMYESPGANGENRFVVTALVRAKSVEPTG